MRYYSYLIGHEILKIKIQDTCKTYPQRTYVIEGKTKSSISKNSRYEKCVIPFRIDKKTLNLLIV